MRKISPWVLFLGVMIFISCNKSPEFTNISIIDYKLEDLRVELTNYDSLPINDLGFPGRLYVYDSIILIVDNEHLKSDKFIHLYNKKGGYIKSIISIGRGPGECYGIDDVKFDQLNNELIIYDIVLGVLNIYELNSILSDNLIFKESYELRSKNNCSRCINIEYVSKLGGYYAHKLVDLDSPSFQFTDINNNEFEQFGEVPRLNGKVEKYNQFNLKILPEMYDGNIIYNQKTSRFFLFYKYMDLIEVYDKEGFVISRNHGPGYFFPSFKPDGKKVNTKEAFSMPKNFEEFVFVLYSGQDYGKNYHYNKLLSIDKKGIIQKYYNLSREICVFEIDSNERKIFAITHLPEPQVIFYEFE